MPTLVFQASLPLSFRGNTMNGNTRHSGTMENMEIDRWVVLRVAVATTVTTVGMTHGVQKTHVQQDGSWPHTVCTWVNLNECEVHLRYVPVYVGST